MLVHLLAEGDLLHPMIQPQPEAASGGDAEVCKRPIQIENEFALPDWARHHAAAVQLTVQVRAVLSVCT